MADKGTLTDAFIEKLREAYDTERQLKKGLKRLGKAAHAPALRAAFEAHLEETRGHETRLEEAFGLLDTKVRPRRCEGIAGILEEAKAVTKRDLDEATMDACLIAVAQSAEHYEIAAYGTLVAWARRLEQEDVTDLLVKILEEEKAVDETLSMLAEDEGVNQAAVEADDDERVDHDDEETPTRKAKATLGGKSLVRKRRPRR